MPRVDPASASGKKVEDLAIVQYWDTEAIPGYLHEELVSYTELNPKFRHMVFSRKAAEEFIAEHFGPREVAAFRSCAVPSMQSDYFRFCAGLVLNGIYSDVDFRCIEPIDSIIPERGQIRLFRSGRGNFISGVYSFRAPGHPFLELALEIATANIERRFPDTVYFAAGPPIFTSLIFLHHVESRDGSIAPIKNPPLQRAVRAYWETIRDHRRVSAALDGVELRSAKEFSKCIRPSGDLPYKHTEMHWLNVKGDIFSSPTASP